MKTLVTTLAGPDRTGIVHAVSGVFAGLGCNIDDSQQFADPASRQFFMRVEASCPEEAEGELRSGLAALAETLPAEIEVHDPGEPGRLLILVSQLGHALNDLLYRHSTGALPARVVGVVSNHTTFEALCTAHGVPFHYLPVSADNRAEQERAIAEIAERQSVSLVVLARYMQILSASLLEALPCRAINIHHSFLPSFKGARPYVQAYDRGVKVIGATAHYVTADLDEGPIIEQEVRRVDHRMRPGDLAAIGQDLESVALARAVTWHLEHRVMLNGRRTVVFS